MNLYKFFSGTFPTSEYLFCAPPGLCKSIILTRFPRFRVSAQRLEDSKEVSFQQGFAHYLEYLRSESK